MKTSRLCALVTITFLLGCSSSDGDDGAAGGAGGVGGGGGAGASGGSPGACDGEYCDEAMWLCRPGIATDHCAEEQTATVYHPDGTTTTETLPKAESPEVDCFYVYPTVALAGDPGNVTDFSNLQEILVPLRAQAVPMTEHCRMFAPLYHQMTLSTYGSPDFEAAVERAYDDVEAAFDTYMAAWNDGRDFIVMGHSQGSHMTRRLLQRRVEGTALADRLVVAMPIGPTSDIVVPEGELVGGTFTELPLCSSATERGCVIAYDSHMAEANPAITTAAVTDDTACVNPAGPDGPTLLKGAYVPAKSIAGQFGANAPDIATDFAVYRDLFTGGCIENDAGKRYYGITVTAEANDVRADDVDLAANSLGALGLHVLDYTFPQEDLRDLVGQKIQAGQ